MARTGTISSMAKSSNVKGIVGTEVIYAAHLGTNMLLQLMQMEIVLKRYGKKKWEKRMMKETTIMYLRGP